MSTKNNENTVPLKKNDPISIKAERRIAPRYHLRFEILLINQKNSLRSRTINLSMSGVLIEDKAPKDFYNGPVDVVIIIPHLKSEQKTYLNFRGLFIGDDELSPRLTFMQDRDQSFDKLKDMIAEIEKVAA